MCNHYEECPECGSENPDDLHTEEHGGRRYFVCECGAVMAAPRTQAERDDERAYYAELRWEADNDR
jgi:hypothetical protein